MQEEGGVERLVGGAAVRMTKMRRCSTCVEGKFPQGSECLPQGLMLPNLMPCYQP